MSTKMILKLVMAFFVAIIFIQNNFVAEAQKHCTSRFDCDDGIQACVIKFGNPGELNQTCEPLAKLGENCSEEGCEVCFEIPSCASGLRCDLVVNSEGENDYVCEKK